VINAAATDAATIIKNLLPIKHLFHIACLIFGFFRGKRIDQRYIGKEQISTAYFFRITAETRRLENNIFIAGRVYGFPYKCLSPLIGSIQRISVSTPAPY